jgi:molybdate transport system ATP-binding protein
VRSAIAIDVQARRGAFQLNASATFSASGITVVLGPSGSGKTTLLRVVAGLEKGAIGSIRIGPVYWLDSARKMFLPPHRRAMGFVFQDGRLFPHLTVRGNLDYAERRVRQRPRHLDRDQILRVFHIEKLVDRPATTLSGGEIQRVAIARALLTNPLLLLMDEPLSAFDLPRRSEALSYIERIPRLFGIPIIYVTHAIEEAAQLAETLAIMNNGRIVATGPAADILARLDLAPYLGRFEAGVILNGTVIGEDRAFGISIVDIDGTALQVPSLGMAKGQTVRLRIRARDVSIAMAKPEGLSIRNIMEVRIEEIAEEEGSAFAELRLKAARQMLRARITRRSVSELRLAPGREVFALIKTIAVDRQLIGPHRRGDGEPAR